MVAYTYIKFSHENNFNLTCIEHMVLSSFCFFVGLEFGVAFTHKPHAF